MIALPNFDSIADALDWATVALAQAGVEGARADSRVLVAHALGVTREHVLAYPERRVAAAQAARLRAAVGRRARREPVARIIGEREFWSLRLRIAPGTLVPRPETECLVEVAADALRARGLSAPRILDLGTGSGAILLALLSEFPDATGIGMDRSAECCRVAAENGRRLGFEDRSRFVQASMTDADWGLAPDQRFDAVVSNPPYVAESDRPDLAPEVALHDPPEALFGGSDGLSYYPEIFARLADRLTPLGFAAVEMGAGQATSVSRLAKAAGLSVEQVARDYAEIERILVLKPRENHIGAKKTLGIPGGAV